MPKSNGCVPYAESVTYRNESRTLKIEFLSPTSERPALKGRLVPSVHSSDASGESIVHFGLPFCYVIARTGKEALSCGVGGGVVMSRM